MAFRLATEIPDFSICYVCRESKKYIYILFIFWAKGAFFGLNHRSQAIGQSRAEAEGLSPLHGAFSSCFDEKVHQQRNTGPLELPHTSRPSFISSMCAYSASSFFEYFQNTDSSRQLCCRVADKEKSPANGWWSIMKKKKKKEKKKTKKRL